MSTNDTIACSSLLRKIRACRHCDNLPLGPKPILQLNSQAKLLIVGQAPGRVTHNKGRPFDDASGDRLRRWLGVNRDEFYDASKVALVPMGFCYPGSSKAGDLPPRPECADQWRQQVLAKLTSLELTLIMGRYALDWHLPQAKGRSITKIVSDWQQFWPDSLPLPHPSPRNNRWLSKNPWFERDLIPALQSRVSELL